MISDDERHMSTIPTRRSHRARSHGLLVVDLTRALAGPHAAMMLGDLGADVIKVENPQGGDDTRGWGPPFVAARRRRAGVDLLPVREPEQEVDHPRPQGRRRQGRPRRAAARADVLMENFRPGVLDRLGFSHRRLAELNPRLVVLSISGFGHDGPEGGAPATTRSRRARPA